MRLVIASSPRLASPDVVFPPRIALCVTFWSLHARCKPDGRTGRGHWRGGRVHELRVEGEERRGYAMGIGWCAATCGRRSLDRAKWKIKKKETKEKKERKRRFENENSISSFSLGGLHRARDFPSDGNLVGPVFGGENVPRTAGGKYLAPAISCYEAGPTKGSRDGFVNSFRTTDFSRFTAELRARVSRCEPRVEIGRLGEDFDRFRWWDTSGLSIRRIGWFVVPCIEGKVWDDFEYMRGTNFLNFERSFKTLVVFSQNFGRETRVNFIPLFQCNTFP